MKSKPFLLFLAVIFTFEGFSQKNNIKTSISGPLFGDFHVGYERMINEKNSVNLKFGVWKPEMSPFITGNTFLPGEYTFQDSKVAVNFSAEYRFYVGKSGMPKGFYVGPYYREFKISARYTDVIENEVFDVSGKVRTSGLGAQLGYQWIIKDVFLIDFSFFGAGLDLYNVKLVYTTPKPGFNYSNIVDDITRVFDDVEYFQKKLKNKVNKNNETTKLPFIIPGLRFNLSIGVAF